MIEHVSNTKDCRDKQIKYKINSEDYKKNSNKLLNFGYSLKEIRNIIFRPSSIVATILKQHNQLINLGYKHSEISDLAKSNRVSNNTINQGEAYAKKNSDNRGKQRIRKINN